MVVNIIIIALAIFVAIKERETFKLALSYEEDEQDEWIYISNNNNDNNRQGQWGGIEMTVDEKIRKILKLMKEYKPLQDYFKVVVSVYGCEMVINLKPFEWEYYGETLEIALDEAIEDLEEAIRERDEDERDYWNVQGARTGKVSCF